MPNLTCVVCGVEFFRYRNGDNVQRNCSRECGARSRTTLKEVHCATCGNAFWVKRSRMDVRACSRACHAAWRKGRFTGTEHSTARRNAALSLTPAQWQVVYGSVLGDGSLGKPKTGNNYHLTLAHSVNQLEYLRWKHDLLAPLASEPRAHRRFDTRFNRTYETWRFHTPSIVGFTDLHRECYTDGIKHLPVSLLERCGPLAVAVWFMDDGTVSSGTPQFATVCFPRSDVEAACEWFARQWGISAHPSKDNRLTIEGVSRTTFRDLIAPLMPASMAYKIPQPLKGTQNRWPH